MLFMKETIMMQIQNFAWKVSALLQIVKFSPGDLMILDHRHLIVTLCKVPLDLAKLYLPIVPEYVFCLMLIN